MMEKQYYPMNAVIYLHSHVPRGEIFSEYGWGGYLIWKYPEKKVFIDGRMPSWVERRDGYKDFSSFELYRGVLQGTTPYTPVFNSYGVTTVLWHKEKTAGKQGVASLIRSLLGQQNETQFIEAIRKDGWQMVYEDNVSAIYQDPLESSPR